MIVAFFHTSCFLVLVLDHIFKKKLTDGLDFTACVKLSTLHEDGQDVRYIVRNDR